MTGSNMTPDEALGLLLILVCALAFVALVLIGLTDGCQACV